MQTDVTRGVQKAVLAARVAGVIAVLLWGWYIVAQFRTQDIGFDLPRCLGVAAFFVLPVAAIPFFGLRWRALVLGVVAVWFAAAASGELWASVEEAQFRQRCAALPAGVMHVGEGRAWPFRHHHLGYVPASKLFYGGD